MHASAYVRSKPGSSNRSWQANIQNIDHEAARLCLSAMSQRVVAGAGCCVELMYSNTSCLVT
jgi:hypothetical protein